MTILSLVKDDITKSSEKWHFYALNKVKKSKFQLGEALEASILSMGP